MIQILIRSNDRYSLPEMAQMAIEGGCGWIVLDVPGDVDVHALADDLVPLCRDAGTILTIAGNAGVARRLEAHGVYLRRGDNALTMRQELGAEAFIGIEVADAAAAATMAHGDIDYVTLPEDMPLDKAAEIIAAARAGGVEIPFVDICAASDMDTKFVTSRLGAGYAGFFVVGGVFDGDDPVAGIERLISTVGR